MTALPVSGTAAGDRYRGDGVVVARRHPARLRGEERFVGRTPHFAFGCHNGQPIVVHDFGADELHNGITDILVAELFAPGWLAGADSFEQVFIGLVTTMHDDPLSAWELFYRNSLSNMSGPCETTTGTLLEFSRIYRHAEHLIAATGAASVLDVGSCFGFLPLRLASGSAGTVRDVIACDVLPEATRLLEQMSHRLGQPIRTFACDAARIPLPQASVDVVTVLHLLEHVDDVHGVRILNEAVRIARRRVIVAVPLEREPETAYGHVRTVTLEDLRSLARRCTGWTGTVSEWHGGWLILDRISPRQ